MRHRLLIAAAAPILAICGDSDTDKIGRASTVFNMLGKNDRVEMEGSDGPDVKGAARYTSCVKKGGLKETVNLEEDTSDAPVSCVQTVDTTCYRERVAIRPKETFKHSANMAFKSRQIICHYNGKRKTSTYLAYSDKIIQDSPENSLSAVSCYNGQKADEWETAEASNRQIFGSYVVDVITAIKR